MVAQMDRTFKGEGKARTAGALEQASKTLNVPLAMLQALVDVETTGIGYDKQGRVKALFEPHRFYKELSRDQAELDLAVKQGLAYPKQGEQPYPKDSYPRILAAMDINEDAALRATSWGLGQILGSNCESAGYDSAEDMVSDFMVGEDEQIDAIVAFLRTNGIDSAMRKLDFDAVAAAYNGKRYRKGGYQTKLKTAYERRTNGAAAVAAKATSGNVTLKAQQRLRDLGYPEVGNVDGKFGKRTRGAISTFQGDHDLPLTGQLDEETLSKLMDVRTAARDQDPERATATVKDVKNATSVKLGLDIKKLGGAILGASGLGGVVTGSIDFQDAAEKLSSMKGFFDVVSGISPWVFAAAGGAFVLYFGEKIVSEQIQAYREGRHV